jgi:hypothetical protein
MKLKLDVNRSHWYHRTGIIALTPTKNSHWLEKWSQALIMTIGDLTLGPWLDTLFS